MCSKGAFALEAKEIFKLAEPSVVVVLAADAKGEKNNFGSGVLIAALDIVTSCKAVEGAADIVVTQGSALRKARLQFEDKERDLCQLHIEDALPEGRPATVAASSNNVDSGQDLFAISAPRGMERTINRTMVSGLRATPGASARLIQIDAQLSGPSSGGGVFDQNAKLVGIITAQYVQSDGATFAVPVDWIAEMAKRRPDRLLAAAAPVAPAAIATAQLAQAEALPAWMPGVGDRWKYRMTYGKQGVGTVNVEISDVHAKTATERITYDRSKGFVKERRVEVGFNPSRFQSLASLPGGYQLMDLAPYADADTDFRAGQSWKDVPGQFAPQGGSNTKTANSKVTVLAKETVRVPAGEFKAWKVESISESIYAINQFFVVKCTYWYAPEIKRTVKMYLHFRAETDAYTSSQTYELISFEQGK